MKVDDGRTIAKGVESSIEGGGGAGSCNVDRTEHYKKGLIACLPNNPL